MLSIIIEDKIDVGFIKDRMFSAMSAPEIQLQLQPKKARKLLNIAQKNDSRTVEWGLLLLKSFENYDNFSTNEQHDILNIRLTISRALLSTNRTAGIEGIENVYRRIMESNEAQKDSLTDLHRHTCSRLIFASKSLRIIYKYISPCYKDSVIKFVPILYLYNFTTKFLKYLAYAIFYIPLDRHTFSNERQDILKTTERQQQTRSSDMISLESNGIAEILNFQIEWNFLGYTWYKQLENICHTLKSDIFLIIINVASVLVRLWIFLTILFTYLGVGLLCISLHLELVQQNVYAQVNDSTTWMCKLYFIIGYNNVLIFVSKLLSWSLQNFWGYVWIGLYIGIFPNNLAQVHPFQSEHFLKLCSDKYFFTRYASGVTNTTTFIRSHPILGIIGFIICFLSSFVSIVCMLLIWYVM